MNDRTLTGPDSADGVVHAGNVTPAEQAAWDVAVRLGLPVTRTDLRSLLRAAEAGDKPEPVPPARELPEAILPAGNRPVTINKPFAIGLTDTSRKFKLTFREIMVTVTGPRESGKTVLENTITAQLARCTDTVIFWIDLLGGRAATPWMLPWVQGHTPRPVIDWLATTREEAVLMLDALLAGCTARARSGEGWEKITPSAEIPAVILMTGATTALAGNPDITRGIAEFWKMCRPEAMGLLSTGLRGGATGLPAEVRIGLRARSVAEADAVFPDNHNAAKALARLRNPGEGLVLAGSDISPAVHFYRTDPGQIADVALATGSRRPAPEERLITAMGEAYTERWNRPHGQQLVEQWRSQLAG
jgi:hypothetical protein